VFRAVLKELTDWITRICDGSWFQSPKFMTVELMTAVLFLTVEVALQMANSNDAVD